MKTITTKYIGPTDHRPSRIIATDGDNRVTLGYNEDAPAIPPEAKYTILARWFTPERAAAIKLCQKLKWTGKLIEGGTKHAGSNVYVFLPHDCLLASRGRLSEDVIDLDAIAAAGITLCS